MLPMKGVNAIGGETRLYTSEDSAIGQTFTQGIDVPTYYFMIFFEECNKRPMA